MAKVGIITMHRVKNYGSALQAYATQYMVEKLGYECEIIDYQYPGLYQFERSPYRHPVIAAKLWWLRPTWLRVKWWFMMKKERRMWRVRLKKGKLDSFEQFYHDFLKLSSFFYAPSSLRSAPPAYDIYMTGSDQVWNPKYAKGDTIFLLDFVSSKKKIAYAASFASDKLEEQFASSFKPLLQQYEAISVREFGGKKIIKDLLGKEVPVVLDPTLLLDADEWSSLSGLCSKHPYQGKKYILVYMLDYAFDPSSVIYDIIRRLQEQTSYEVVSIGNFDKCKFSPYKAVAEAGPLEFLQLFRYASYVVTSSFHGTAFAVNFGIPLYPVVPPFYMSDDRQLSLLKSLGLEKCAIPADVDINTIDLREIEETSKQGYGRLQELRKKSIACLAQMLSQNFQATCH